MSRKCRKLTCAGADEAAAATGWRALLAAGANDFGGVSPLTKDYVNPEKPWPHVAALAAATAAAGMPLVPRYHAAFRGSSFCRTEHATVPHDVLVRLPAG